MKNLPTNIGDTGDASGKEIPRGGNDNTLKYSSLENSMNRGAWQASPWGSTESKTQVSD